MTTLFILLQHLLPQQLLSRITGRFAECRVGWFKNLLIRTFIARYGVNMAEAEQPDYRAFEHFNAFFTRRLRADARPLLAGDGTVCCPADGVVSAIGAIREESIFQAKGRDYSLTALLGGDATLAGKFRNGSFATIYLSPKDYHRVHMPATGTLQSMHYIPGKLFSVNQATAASIDSLFARNERLVCMFDTGAGPMAVILVGAMIVAGIETRWAGLVAPDKAGRNDVDYGGKAPVTLQTGEEMGLFRLGSTVIVLFPAERCRWTGALAGGSAVRMGEAIGDLSAAPAS